MPDDAPQLWIIVGGNGAGKSTFFKLFLEPLGVAFINADIIARELNPENPESASYDASVIGEQQRSKALMERQNFCFETVFSHPSKIDFIAHAKALGYEVNMVVIYLDPPELNIGRVAMRVSEGGHNVPVDKIISRIPRAHQHVGQAITLCDNVDFFDNSSREKPFTPMVSKEEQHVVWHSQPVPDWIKQLFV